MRTIVIAALAALSLAAPALAAEKYPPFVISVPVKDKPGQVMLDPAKAYVLLRSEVSTTLMLMRVPSPADQAQWDKMRADALAEAHAKYVKKKKSYDAALKDYESGQTAKYAARPEKPVEPVEPTDANFEFTPFPLLAVLTIGPYDRFTKAEGGASSYLQALTPGEYRIYGPLVAPGYQAPVGTCFCMGSVAFTVRAGEIVDMGLITNSTSAPAARVAGDSSAPALRTQPFIVPAPAGTAVDPRLAGLTIVPAKYRPVGKLPNFYGVAIDRMPAMPGVMRYDRDRIVDLTTGN